MQPLLLPQRLLPPPRPPLSWSTLIYRSLATTACGDGPQSACWPTETVKTQCVVLGAHSRRQEKGGSQGWQPSTDGQTDGRILSVAFLLLRFNLLLRLSPDAANANVARQLSIYL